MTAGAGPVFRLGVSEIAWDADWPERAREAERLGYDTFATTDHLGMTAPFPSLATAAAATTRIGLATYLTNTSLWDPEVLAREVAGTDRLSGGRLTVGLHAGQTSTTATASLTARDRYDRLAATVEALDRLLRDPAHRPRPARAPRPGLMIGAREPDELDLAARRADTVCFVGAALPPGGGFVLDGPDAFAAQVALVRARAAELGRAPELNTGVKKVVVTDDRRAAADALRPALAPHLTADQLLGLPSVLIGTHEEIARQIRRDHDRYGLTSYMILTAHLYDFAPVIPLLRKG
ncbi:LLM class flavin-dependent oxidoreductase [Streptomyces sp. GF20]|uniref:LLM class flavin-dependent oxidoreductase n=1 Tax=Streptomyces TaxID=1883 RepID=UPI00101F6685|nr:MULTISPECIES: LLM class flavin-dependent oxidoreductase [Streptomyces]QHC14354.1 LLM class flavin-dependent oxidoreductase [Streptomyces sp. GF20]RZD54718.1 LLM class F420-dependent oxidoreductase [Streptomyces albidoflavus]